MQLPKIYSCITPIPLYSNNVFQNSFLPNKVFMKSKYSIYAIPNLEVFVLQVDFSQSLTLISNFYSLKIQKQFIQNLIIYIKYFRNYLLHNVCVIYCIHYVCKNVLLSYFLKNVTDHLKVVFPKFKKLKQCRKEL